MQLPAQIHEAGAAPASPTSSSPGSDPGSSKSTGTPGGLEKPVKVLPCPRCESMNTKFCYYNNYSVTQPRHFCRQCQRYWTVGGTLRNVPVGGGSRKKNRHHPRGAGEPYNNSPRSSPGAANSSGPNFAGFQQQQEMVALNFAGFAPQSHPSYAPYGLDQLSQLSPGVYASILNKLETESTPSSLQAVFGSGPMSSINPGGYFQHDTAASSFQNDHVKPEFWPTSSMAAPQGNYNPGNYNRNPNGRFDQMLNFGLNNSNRPQSAAPVWDDHHPHHPDVKPAASTTVKNGSTHGSSIEDEGSTPSNGFSRSQYEEAGGADAVSSMWHSLHDMDNLQLSVKW